MKLEMFEQFKILCDYKVMLLNTRNKQELVISLNILR